MRDGDNAAAGHRHGSDDDGAAGQRLTVAELIARIGTTPPEGGRAARRRRAEHEPEGIAASEDPSQDATTTPLPALTTYVSEIPDLSWWEDEATRSATDAATERIAAGPVPPEANIALSQRLMLAGRALTAVIATLAIALTGGAWYWSTSKNNSLNRVSALDLNSRDIVDPNAQFGDENFLIVGVDSRFGENADIGAGDTDEVDGARSDTIMLVNIPASRKRVVAVSFPRDLAITPLLCDAWDPESGKYQPVYNKETGSYGPDEWYTETKLNSAYGYGGPKCLVKAIQKLSGLSINRFMAIDFAGFAKMVDHIGGVEVCSATPMMDDELGTVLPKAGWQKVDGSTALSYVRARSVTTEINGDYGRIKRQQLFLSSLLRSMISKDVFFSLKKLNNVVNSFIDDSYVDNVQTKDLVQLGQSLQDIAAGRITFLTVPTTGYSDEWGNEHMRIDDTQAIFDAIIDDDPLPGETGTPEAAAPATADSAQTDRSTTSRNGQYPEQKLLNTVTTEPRTVTVHVSNSTEKLGLAASATRKLKRQGFSVLTPDDYPNSLPSTTVFFSSGNERAAATVAAMFAHAKLERVSGMGNIVQVVLGPDFSNVGAVLPSGSPVRVQVTVGSHSKPSPLPSDLDVTNAADRACE